jgi:hypothetical protein
MTGQHVKSAFKIRKWSKVHNNDQIVLNFLVKDEQTGLHICAKRICDRLSSFEIIHQKVCQSYGEQYSRLDTRPPGASTVTNVDGQTIQGSYLVL